VSCTVVPATQTAQLEPKRRYEAATSTLQHKAAWTTSRGHTANAHHQSMRSSASTRTAMVPRGACKKLEPFAAATVCLKTAQALSNVAHDKNYAHVIAYLLWLMFDKRLPNCMSSCIAQCMVHDAPFPRRQCSLCAATFCSCSDSNSTMSLVAIGVQSGMNFGTWHIQRRQSLPTARDSTCTSTTVQVPGPK
jgi:hypothetical protein